MNEVNLEEMYEELANHFKAASQLFGQLSTPESVQDLLRTLATGDQKSFNRLGDSLEFPLIGRCD